MREEESIRDKFRRWGYLEADLDPLGRLKPLNIKELQVDGPEAQAARSLYCGTIGVEFMQIPDRTRREWLIKQIEEDPEDLDRERICERLANTEIFEEVLQKRYIGSKRFSIEGVAATIPLLDSVIESAAEGGARGVVLGTAHRGRLNIMVHIVGKDPEEIFVQFEDVDPKSVLGGGDVIYHKGANGRYQVTDGSVVAVSLVSNPSHLEAVTPVVLGRTRAKQERTGAAGTSCVVPIILHGDAAFAGQGVLAESLNLADLAGYTVGGTIHIIVNNLIGFTASPNSLHSSRFASDVAKRLPIPILHVNGEDPDAVVRVGRLAATYRSTFESDVVIDLIGYRRWGHSEIEDPKVSHPRLYEQIEKHRPLWRSYADTIGLDREAVEETEKRIKEVYSRAHERALGRTQRASLSRMPEHWARYVGGYYDPAYEVETAVQSETMRKIGQELTEIPERFHLYPKLEKFIDQRRKMAAGEVPIDWSFAEALAFATLLEEGVSVRLTGQDTRRGTFNQRHAVWIDTVTGEEFCPLHRFGSGRARFQTFDSPLTEFAAVGYEYGYSRDAPDSLVLWEAQFGDFANGAQVLIDQFISAAEDKWELLSGLVFLLPHGYEGQGPEHSSARIERFLQLAAEDNLQICRPSTSTQYFHLLRRQVLRKWRKPLIVFTPKGYLRRKEVGCALDMLASDRFQEVMSEEGREDARRVLLCTGMIGHALREQRALSGADDAAIMTVEQLFPFPEVAIERELGRYPQAELILWIQEEPGNMGAQNYMLPKLRRLAGNRQVRCIRRAESASPATGSRKAFEIEQKTLLQLALGGKEQTIEGPEPTQAN